MKLEKYTEKSFVIVGDTKKYKEIFKENGGKWNKGLTINGSQMEGWVFSNNRKESLKKALKEFRKR